MFAEYFRRNSHSRNLKQDFPFVPAPRIMCASENDGGQSWRDEGLRALRMRIGRYRLRRRSGRAERLAGLITTVR